METPKKRWIQTYFQDVMDMKMKHFKIKTSFVSPEGAKTKTNKTGIICQDFHFKIHGKFL